MNWITFRDRNFYCQFGSHYAIRSDVLFNVFLQHFNALPSGVFNDLVFIFKYIPQNDSNEQNFNIKLVSFFISQIYTFSQSTRDLGHILDYKLVCLSFVLQCMGQILVCGRLIRYSFIFDGLKQKLLGQYIIQG